MAKYGYFIDSNGKRLDHPEPLIRHLPGKPLMCPCWLSWMVSWIVSLVAVLLPRCLSFSVRVWLRRPTIWWLEDPQFELVEDLCFVDSTKQEWKVEAPFVFNGPSIPPVFVWLIPRSHSGVLAASAVHDMQCTAPYQCNSITASRVFWEAMRANGYYRWGAWRNWFAVRYFGPQFKPGRA